MTKTKTKSKTKTKTKIKTRLRLCVTRTRKLNIYLGGNNKENDDYCLQKTFSLLFSAKIKYLTMTDAKKVWMPDTFFRNEKEGRFHNILVPNVYIRIFPNGDVLYSIR